MSYLIKLNQLHAIVVAMTDVTVENTDVRRLQVCPIKGKE